MCGPATPLRSPHNRFRTGIAARDRLPTLFPSSTTTARTSPFCRTCLSNQALQLHLLASYPLDESSSSSEHTTTQSHHASEIDPYPPLDEYRRSLDLRYPLVCAECAPAVESTIRERDYRVKAQALGWRLRETQRRREEEERRSDEARRREGRDWIVQGLVWRLRGVAWASTHVTAIAAAYSGAFPQPLSTLRFVCFLRYPSILASNSLHGTTHRLLRNASPPTRSHPTQNRSITSRRTAPPPCLPRRAALSFLVLLGPHLERSEACPSSRTRSHRAVSRGLPRAFVWAVSGVRIGGARVLTLSEITRR